MKHRLRKEIRAVLAEMTPEAACDKSSLACEKLVALEEFHDASVVMVYLDIPNEVDVAHVVHAAWREDKAVLVPKVIWDHKHMKAVEIYSLKSGLVETPQGLREPPEGKSWPIERIDFIVVPALAYDFSGNRLGRGGGFYDRFLGSEKLRAVTCGIAFAEQVVADLPTHSHDRPVDILVTDKHLLRFDSRRSHNVKVQEK